MGRITMFLKQYLRDPQIQNVFRWALIGEQENATRFVALMEEFINEIMNYGAEPFVVDIEEVTKQNNNFRTALWTGTHLQVTLMSIDVGEDIGLEIHPTLDQFLLIEQGKGIVQMGDSKDRLNFEEKVFDDYAIVIPAGKWHNLTNTGNQPLTLYSIYAPPQHPYGTIHETKAIAIAIAIAMAAERTRPLKSLLIITQGSLAKAVDVARLLREIHS